MLNLKKHYKHEREILYHRCLCNSYCSIDTLYRRTIGYYEVILDKTNHISSHGNMRYPKYRRLHKYVYYKKDKGAFAQYHWSNIRSYILDITNNKYSNMKQIIIVIGEIALTISLIFLVLNAPQEKQLSLSTLGLAWAILIAIFQWVFRNNTIYKDIRQIVNLVLLAILYLLLP